MEVKLKQSLETQETEPKQEVDFQIV